ncbi:MAG: DUF3438 family protein [Gammaproteobacteria bacterium]|nr:DUF3438 family protein [Gammaproteobacteria bacterium]
MSQSFWLFALSVIVMLIATFAQAGSPSNTATTRVVAYRGVPIDLHLPLNHEIRIHLDESVEVGVPIALTSKLDVTSVHGVVFLTAVQAFTAHRVALKGSTSGQIVLVDVSAITDASEVKDVFVRTDGATVTPDDPPELTMVQLMRHIAHLTLAPRGSAVIPFQIKRIALVLPHESIYRDFAVASSLLAAWRTDRKMALAVELRNQSDEAIVLSPDEISGVWYAVGFQHTRLLPYGKRGAQTVVFLVGAHDAIADLQR